MTALATPPTATSPPEGDAVRAAGRRRPSLDVLIDLAATVVLAAIGLAGFERAFGSLAPLGIGLVGVAGGVALVALLERTKLPGPLGLAAVVIAFVLLGGAAVPDVAIAGVLPGPEVPATLLRGLLDGWVNLVTTAPPVGTGDGLGVVPYACGWIAGLGGYGLARRTTSPLGPAAPATLALGAGIVFGTAEPFSILIQGVGFAAVALAWGANRGDRGRKALTGEVDWARLAGAVGMLVVLLAGAFVVSPKLPGFHDDDRYVLRRHVVPPFDPRDYPSPLGGFRNYVDEAKRDEVLFEVRGLPEDARIRLSTMDSYDGVAWVVGGEQSSASGRFERVGRAILPTPPGRAATLQVEVADYEGVWVPVAGTTRSLAFGGARADELSDAFRYNAATGVAASPDPVREGDRYEVEVKLPTTVDRKQLAGDAVDSGVVLPPVPELPDALQKKASDIIAGAGSPFEQAEALEAYFQEGYYSDGGPKDTGAARSAPGHSLARLSRFLEKEKPVGNAEQYAAAMALLARSVNLPARVVVGFRPTDVSGTVGVTGAMADAWVEVAFEDAGWQVFDPTPDHTNTPKEQKQPPPKQEELAQQEPQVEEYLEPPDTTPDLASQRPPTPPTTKPEGKGFQVPRVVLLVAVVGGVPLLVGAAVVGLILGLKRLRRNRRRQADTASGRVAGAWAEVLDSARDRGVRLVPRQTRLEVATAVPGEVWPSAAPFAQRVDAILFGPGGADDSVVAGVWDEADRERSGMLAGLGLRQRWRARLSLRSLRPSR